MPVVPPVYWNRATSSELTAKGAKLVKLFSIFPFALFACFAVKRLLKLKSPNCGTTFSVTITRRMPVSGWADLRRS
jgi:flagellar biogenesis protein FliO